MVKSVKDKERACNEWQCEKRFAPGVRRLMMEV